MTDERFPSDGPFESDLRAVLEQMAPGDVPEPVRAFVATVPLAVSRPARREWLPRSRRLAGAIAFVAVAFVAVLGLIATRPTPGPGGPSTPKSTLISGFVNQVDGLYGYQMLRPSNWTPFDGGFPQGRFYVGPGPANAQEGILLTVVNLKLVAEALGPNSANAEWLIFEQDSSLAGWTAGIEAMWTRDGSTFTRLRTLPEARLYAVTMGSDPRTVYLIAYAIDQGQPLLLVAQASGTQADLGRLQAEGFVDDLATMAASLKAIPADPHNIAPPLPSGPLPSPSVGPSTGTTETVYQLAPVDGRTPDQVALSATIAVMTARAQAFGLEGVTVTARPPDEVVVTLPTAELDASQALGETGLVQFIPLPAANYGTASTSANGPLGVTQNQALPIDPSLVPLIDSSAITSATAGKDQNGSAVVDFTLSSVAASKFATYTAHNVGNYFAIVLDGIVISAPSVNSAISDGKGEITVGAGANAQAEVDSLATILKFGALPFPIREIGAQPGT
jgi:hypothetical protein